MLGIEELKEEIELTETTVECPVRDCDEKVERQKKSFKKENRFLCPKHNIYISSSTFEYPSELDNLLWKDSSDIELLDRLSMVKRESRMARERSEDALSWNVFRFLERNDLVAGLLGSITNTSPKSSEVIYWSFSQRENASWSLLNRARTEFGERIERSSEPDIIIKTDDALYFIEAKFTSGNTTTPSNKKEFKKYKTGGDNWFSEVFHSDYETVAMVEKKYELLRFWLLGTWMAKQQDLDFYLINLVLDKRETDIESIFRPHIKENQRRKFQRMTWETIHQYISDRSSSKEKEIMMRNFKNRTIGYSGKGRLQKAFSIQ